MQIDKPPQRDTCNFKPGLSLPNLLPDSTPSPSSHSRFAQRIRRRYQAQLPLLRPGIPDQTGIALLFDALRHSGEDIGAALRIARQLVLERLLCLDCEAGASLETVTTAMTLLAEFALDVACTESLKLLDAAHGAPLNPQGQRARLWVVGMGKLGARELNVSSDIDLIYVYDHDGETAGNAQGRSRLSNHEYFAKCVRAIYSLMGETTEHGFVFRVDLALRPNGNSGPPAVSLGALEEYFHVQGREWERFAWLKSRVIAPLQGGGNGGAQALRSVVLPFVFRRYLDYNVFDALRVLHRQIREHAARRSAGRPERTNDVKLSRGGIREIEFIVQLLQVVRGGQYPELRTRPTRAALQRIAKAGLMPQGTADALSQAYAFLRRVEHRIQYLDDQQTHVLPTQDDDLGWIAQTLGCADPCVFLSLLDTHRELVAQEFDLLLGGGHSGCKTGGCHRNAGSPEAPDFDALLAQLPDKFRERVSAWRGHPRVLALREDSRARLIRLLDRTAQWLREGRVSEEAAVRIAEWMEPLLRRESYLALLLERPMVHERLLRLLGAARWPARYLLKHPGVIDELASNEMINERFAAADFERALELRRSALQVTGEDDDEALLTSGVCHVSGSYQSGQTPVWLGAPDPYVSAHAFPGIIVRDPYSSKLIVKGPHAGPAFTGNNKDLGDRVLAWLTQEALAIKVQPLPGTDAFGVAGGPNTVDISGGGTGVAGAKITFDAAIDGAILTLTNVKLVAPAGTGVHVAHPVFTRVLASGKTVDDPVDSFSNLDQTQAAGTTQPLGTGFLILSSWSASDKMKIGFSTLGAATVADAGPTGGCKSLATFVSGAVPAIQQNSCLNCHDQGGSGASALDLSSVGKDNARACAQALNKVNLADKPKSAIIQAPTGGLGNHPFQNASGNYTAMMLGWINNE